MHWTLIPLCETVALFVVICLVVPGKWSWLDLPLVVLIWCVAVGPSVLTGLLAASN